MIIITKPRVAIAVITFFMSTMIVPIFSESYTVRKHQIKTDVMQCMENYSNSPFGSGDHKAGCAKCIGLGMSKMQAQSNCTLDSLDYGVTIKAKACQGYKNLNPIMISLPKKPLYKLAYCISLIPFIIFFLPEVPVKRIRKKWRKIKSMIPASSTR